MPKKNVLRPLALAVLLMLAVIAPKSLAAAAGEAEPGATPSETVETQEDKGGDIDPNG